MTGKAKFMPGRGYSESDWDDTDSPEATDEQIASAKPFAEAFPELADSIRRGRGRPPADNPRQQVSIRLSPDIIAHFKKGGPGWQSRINDALRKVAGL